MYLSLSLPPSIFYLTSYINIYTEAQMSVTRAPLEICRNVTRAADTHAHTLPHEVKYAFPSLPSLLIDILHHLSVRLSIFRLPAGENTRAILILARDTRRTVGRNRSDRPSFSTSLLHPPSCFTLLAASFPSAALLSSLTLVSLTLSTPSRTRACTRAPSRSVFLSRRLERAYRISPCLWGVCR